MPKIVRFHETGEADVLRLEELPDSQPGKGEVRLKVAAIGGHRRGPPLYGVQPADGQNRGDGIRAKKTTCSLLPVLSFGFIVAPMTTTNPYAAIVSPPVCCVKPLTPAAHGSYNGDTHPIRSFRRPYPFPLTSASQPNAWRERIVSWR